MLDNPFKLGLYVLALVPGYLFVQIKNHHLLREERSQFATSLEVIFASAIIWVIACLIPPVCLFYADPADLIRLARDAFAAQAESMSGEWERLLKEGGLLILLICGWTFLFANIWGKLRQSVRFGSSLNRFFGRDWYPSVALRYYKESVGKVVVVQAGPDRYLGTLAAAPDRAGDGEISNNPSGGHIILMNVSKLPPIAASGDPQQTIQPQELTQVDMLLLSVKNISEMRTLTEDVMAPPDSPEN
ncbi:MAG: DUF6338 family protein [Bdellovibrionota bacterium]